MLAPASFQAAYDVELIDSVPTDEIDYVFRDAPGGSSSCTVSIVPFMSGSPWVGEFVVKESRLRAAVSGLFATPNPNALCVVHCGVVFMVDVSAPSGGHVVVTDGPVVSVQGANEASLLLLVTPWAITAIGADGPRWTTARIAIDGVRVDEVENGWLRGVADPEDEEPRNFGLDLSTGEVLGGAGIS